MALCILGHGFDHESVHAVIVHQQVGAVAHHHRGNLPGTGQLHRLHQLLRLSGQRHQRRRTAHPKGGVAAHRLILTQFQLGQPLPELLVQLMYLIHMQTLRLVSLGWYLVRKILVYYSRIPVKKKVWFSTKLGGALSGNAPPRPGFSSRDCSFWPPGSLPAGRPCWGGRTPRWGTVPCGTERRGPPRFRRCTPCWECSSRRRE